jgi:hypothetical protein
MSGFKGLSITINQAPKVVRNKAKLVRKLWREGNLTKLRELRDLSKNMEIIIYHHSFGTDSYYHDIEGRYYTWNQIQHMSNTKLDAGKTFLTVVMPYKSGIHFTKSSLSPSPSLN